MEGPRKSEEPISVTKEIVVDAFDPSRLERTHPVRRIEFEVPMEFADPTQQWRYSEPVGFSSIKRGSTMRVFYAPMEEAVVNERRGVVRIMVEGKGWRDCGGMIAGTIPGEHGSALLARPTGSYNGPAIWNDTSRILDRTG